MTIYSMAGDLIVHLINIYMTGDKEKDKAYSDENTALPPDEETLHTPDPQKNMDGPVSSTMHKIGEDFDTQESKREADKRKDDHM